MIGEDFKAVVVATEHSRDSAGQYPFALRFGTGGGSAVVRAQDGSTVQLDNIANGETFPCYTKEVVSVTGTVAGIVAIYENQV